MGIREIARIEAVRSEPSPLTNLASALKVSASLPRTVVSATIAERRTAPSSPFPPMLMVAISRCAGRLSA